MGLAASKAREKRWRRLEQIVGSLDRLFEASARLDVYDPVRPYGADSEPPCLHERRVWRFERELARIERYVEREADRITVDRLALDLALRRQRTAVLPPVTVCDPAEPCTRPDVDAFWLDIGRPHDPTRD